MTANSEPKSARSESVIFAELRELCAQPGYAHALAFMCVQDHALLVGETFSAKDLEPGFDPTRLIRTEISVLTRLWAQSARDLSVPDAQTIEAQIAQTYALLEEMHHAINAPNMASMRAMFEGKSAENPLKQGAFFREAIFYAPLSAYFFQFRDFAPLRYSQDADWLRKHRGFSADEARVVVDTIAAVVEAQFSAIMEAGDPSASFVPGFRISPAQVAAQANLELSTVKAVFDAFSLKGPNAGFNAIDDYNEINAFPLVPVDDDAFVVFDIAGVYQSLYESPIFWMRQDKAYAETANEHRGAFTETFARDRLRRCFGEARVFTNVKLFKGKDEVGEIDVLVVFGDRLIVLQAKSKSLTIQARKGSDLQIQEDFKAAVEVAYGQALDCARHLIARDVDIVLPDGTALKLPEAVHEVFPVCLVADHYPSLSTQVRSSLTPTVTDVIRAPFVMDIFLLDAMTEMLTSPLRLLSYLHLRAEVMDRVAVLHELTCLSFHLQKNLSLHLSENDFLWLEDDISAELDAAMMVRRLGYPGEATPKGILTMFAGTPFEKLITQLEHSQSPAAIELGFLLLRLGPDTVGLLNEGIRRQCKVALHHPGPHDFTLALFQTSGLTVHVNATIDEKARQRALDHGKLKKHQQKRDEWFVVLLDPRCELRFAAVSRSPWEPSKEMDHAVATLLPPVAPAKSIAGALAAKVPRKKVGVNDPCPCGSGKKFKKCHLWKS